MTLTDKQLAFCHEYCKDFNGNQAAIRAGYSEKTARKIADQLLNKPEILEQVEILKKQLTKRHEITRDRLIQELSKIAFFNPRVIYKKDAKGWIVKDPDDISDDDFSALSEINSVETFSEDSEGVVTRKTNAKVKPADKIKAVELMAKMLGFDKPEVTEEELLNRPKIVSYRDFYNMTEDEKVIYLSSGQLPEAK